MKSYLSILLLSFVMLSCKTATSANPVDANVPITSNEVFFNRINANLDFEQIKINSKVNVETGNFVPTLDATIYLENNQKVWMNMNAFFLNVGRGLATSEGVKGYEKWNKTYIDSDFSYLNSLLNVNFIDLNNFQRLLLGRTFIPVNSNSFVLTKNAQGFLLSSKENQRIESNGKTYLYSIALRYSEEGDLNQATLTNVTSNENLEVNYSNWLTEGGMRLPKNVKINIKGAKNSQILLENTTFDFDKMNTPYSVPANYTKTEIK